MKKWFAFALFTLLSLTTLAFGISCGNDDSSFAFSLNEMSVEIGTSEEISFEISEDCEISFSVENTEIADIVDGKIYGKKVGRTYLTAEANFKGKLYYESALIIITEENIRLAYPEPSPIIYVGQTISVRPTILTGENKCNFAYSSSNSSILSVDPLGNILAKSCGNADIIVKNNNQIDKTFHFTISYDYQIIPDETSSVLNKNTLLISSENSGFNLIFVDKDKNQVVVDTTSEITSDDGIVCWESFGKYKITATQSGKIYLSFININATIEVNIIVDN